MPKQTPVSIETYTADGGTRWLRFNFSHPARVIGIPVDGSRSSIAPGAHAEGLAALADATLDGAPVPTLVRWEYDDDADMSFLEQDCFQRLEPDAIPADHEVQPLTHPRRLGAPGEVCHGEPEWHRSSTGQPSHRCTECGFCTLPDDDFDPVTCGSCGLTWNDAEITGMTPTPSARCPFEAYHFDPHAEAARLVALSYVVLDQYGEHLDSLYGITLDAAETYFTGEHPATPGDLPANLAPYQFELLADVLTDLEPVTA